MVFLASTIVVYLIFQNTAIIRIFAKTGEMPTEKQRKMANLTLIVIFFSGVVFTLLFIFVLIFAPHVHQVRVMFTVEEIFEWVMLVTTDLLLTVSIVMNKRSQVKMYNKQEVNRLSIKPMVVASLVLKILAVWRVIRFVVVDPYTSYGSVIEVCIMCLSLAQVMSTYYLIMRSTLSFTLVPAV